MSESGTRKSYFSSAIECIKQKDSLESCSVHLSSDEFIENSGLQQKNAFHQSLLSRGKWQLNVNLWTVKQFREPFFRFLRKIFEWRIYISNIAQTNCANKENLWTASTGSHYSLPMSLSFIKTLWSLFCLFAYKTAIPFYRISQKCWSMTCAIKFVPTHLSSKAENSQIKSAGKNFFLCLEHPKHYFLLFHMPLLQNVWSNRWTHSCCIDTTWNRESKYTWDLEQSALTPKRKKSNRTSYNRRTQRGRIHQGHKFFSFTKSPTIKWWLKNGNYLGDDDDSVAQQTPDIER